MTTLGERIVAARENKQITQAQLAQAIGKDPSAISRAERGDRKVSSFELGQIADALRVDVRDLLGIERTTPALALAARVAEAVPMAESSSAVAKVSAVLEVEGILDQLGEAAADVPANGIVTPEMEDPVLAGEEAARVVRDTLGIPAAPLPPNLPRWIEGNFRVDVIRMSLPDGIAGLCVRSGERSIAVVSQNDFALRQRFTLAHELAHHVFQDGDTVLEESTEDLSSRNNDPVEKRANAFAAKLLLPDELAKERCRDGASEEVVLDLMFDAGMSWKAVVYRLHNLGLIDASGRDHLLSGGPSGSAYRAGRLSEWHSLLSADKTSREPVRIAKRAIAAYEKGLVGIGPVAEGMLRDDREALRHELAAEGLEPPIH